MSSVVNKSGTRFVPKVRQRRVNTPSSTPNLDITAKNGTDEKDTGSVTSTLESTEDIDPIGTLNADNEDGSFKTGTLHIDESGDKESFAVTGRRSSRLDSLSSSNAVPSIFKASFTDSSATSNTDRSGGRQLSIIGSIGTKIPRLNSISENDAALQALKKRRLSVRSSTSKKTGSVHRISILPATQNYADDSTTSSSELASQVSNPNLQKQSNGFFQRTDSLYEKYTVQNLKEIPKNLEDSESSKYMIDEEKFTIAELCKPVLPIGEISENFERAQEASKAKQQKRKERREQRQRARKEFKSLQLLNKEEVERETQERKQKARELMEANIPEFSQKSQVAIQLKINKDGTLVVDEESTMIDRHQNASLENAQKEKVDENPFENLYNSATYGRNAYTDPWTTEELVKFYKALSMWGTDFNLISQLFPYRTRKQVKAKFINEEKKNPVIIELALRSRLPPDFERYCEDTKQNIGTIDHYNKKLEELQQQHNEHLKEIEEAKKTAKTEDANTVTDKDFNKKSSGGFMTNQLKTYRKSEIVLGTIDDLKRKKQEEQEETSAA